MKEEVAKYPHPDAHLLPASSLPSDPTEWTAWSICSVTCGRGQRYRSRYRECNIENNRLNCIARTSDSEYCEINCEQRILNPTASNNIFASQWSNWSNCRYGNRERTRACSSCRAGLEVQSERCSGVVNSFSWFG